MQGNIANSICLAHYVNAEELAVLLGFRMNPLVAGEGAELVLEDQHYYCFYYLP